METRWADRSAIAAYALLSASLAVGLAGCGSKAKAPAPAPAAPPAPAAAGPDAPVVPEAPPDLGVDVERFVLAKVTEGCAKRFGEAADDARLLAVDSLLGLAHQPPESAEVRRSRAARKGVPLPGEATASQRTTAGRVPAAADGREEAAAALARAETKAAEIPALGRRIEDAVATCHYAAQVGLVPPAVIESYIRVFVEITCLGESTRRPDGALDETAHAQAAAEVFRGAGTNARDFSQLGLTLGVFEDVTARIAEARRERCPDRRTEALGPISGAFELMFEGQAAITGELKAQDGEASATTRVLIKGAPPKTLALTGVVQPNHVHLQGGEGQDWLRLDGKPDQPGAAAAGGRGTWEAMMGFKKLRGTWKWQPRAAAGEGAPAPAATAPASPAPSPAAPPTPTPAPRFVPADAPLAPAAGR